MIVELLLLVQITSTLAMVGLIWFVQVVHYPLFSAVGRSNFGHYERSHQRRTTIVVAPLMLAEALTATTMIWCRPDGISQSLALFGVALVATLWISTFFWQVPAHEQLMRSFDTNAHRRLVLSNWFRTAVWTARGLLVSWLCLQLLKVNSL